MKPFTATLPVALALVVSLGTASQRASAADFVVDQKDKQFGVKLLKIKPGDTVEFKNSDSIAHNIFSLSDVKPFDLGSYTPGQSKKVTFDKPGKVEVECSIHPAMQMVIEVSK